MKNNYGINPHANGFRLGFKNHPKKYFKDLQEAEAYRDEILASARTINGRLVKAPKNTSPIPITGVCFYQHSPVYAEIRVSGAGKPISFTCYRDNLKSQLYAAMDARGKIEGKPFTRADKIKAWAHFQNHKKAKKFLGGK